MKSEDKSITLETDEKTIEEYERLSRKIEELRYMNKEMKKILVEHEFEEAEIIMNQGKRYYFQIGRETIVRGLSETGEVIDRQGG